ncbi:MAG: flagellar basal body P-ring formation chaperone FlgA [Nitrospira sp.]|nr:flagellar basal body P-ring formation chaperone FlgA [Nitrospira sp.]MDH5498634.1 flagellar basal body P-ring formation chaperone FlgA [Nitrospira sp.]MDH5725599.1 flagellar basal body P-ring formation chaperone FlgA [Nitrospira sp.]
MSRIPIVLIIGALLAVTTATVGTSADAHPTSMKTKPPMRETSEGRMERAKASEVTPDLLRKAIQTYLQGEWGQKVKTAQVTIMEPADPVVVTGGPSELHVIPSPTEDGPGRRMFRVAATNGKSQKTIQVVAEVTAMIDAVVPNRFLKADELIDVGDIKTVQMRVHQVNHPFMTQESEVIGMSAARPLPPDVPLRHAFVRLPLAVKKGDRVLIEAQRGGLSIRTYGITKSSGQVGQTITVSNLDSGRELTAKVVGPSLVQVEF